MKAAEASSNVLQRVVWMMSDDNLSIVSHNMQIHVTKIGKRFNREWIFRNVEYTFQSNQKYALTGPNGSGKSTLLQIIAGATIYNEGKISYVKNNEEIQDEFFYKECVIVAPYLELIEEMTATEFLQFHHQFKKLHSSIPEILEQIGIAHSAHKQIRYFSSGMKQRLKLGQAFFSDATVLLLDEPTTNLDAEGIALYQSLIQNQTQNKLVIISSNDVNEYGFCNAIVNISDYK